MKKVLKLFVILNILVLLTGCNNNETLTIPSIKYSMDFNNDINEKIEIYMPSGIKDKVKDYTPKENDTILPPQEYTFIFNDNFPIKDNFNYAYKKSDLEETDKFTHLDLTAELNYNNIIDSATLNQCFEKTKIETQDDHINILLGGYFICNYGDETTLEFKGKNIISTSLPKVDANTYRMKIGNEIEDYITLSISTKQIENKEESKGMSIFTQIYIALGVILAIIVIFIIFIAKKLDLV